MTISKVDTNSDDVDTQKINDFTKNVGPRVRNDPLYCSTTACLGNDGKPMAVWSRHLHDVFYLYGLSLNDSLSLDPVGGQSNASTLSHSMKRSFVGSDEGDNAETLAANKDHYQSWPQLK
ncbi:hypothetical protein RB195_003338 [Necator americanus]|uniref:Uncharacterized protein n=1 Tax=Necator americanus TaxID=51031 RepID=A0ABR1DN69_NECAM